MLINLVGLGRNKVAVGDNPERKQGVDSTQASKVDIAKEMVNQTTAQAEFTANAKIIAVADEMIGTILDVKILKNPIRVLEVKSVELFYNHRAIFSLLKRFWFDAIS